MLSCVILCYPVLSCFILCYPVLSCVILFYPVLSCVILAGNRLCYGGEATIWDCPLQGGRTETQSCSHDLDQGVSCTGPTVNGIKYILYYIYSIYYITPDDVCNTYGAMSPGRTSGGKICPSNDILKQEFSNSK